jgi:hypothetical protein
MGRKDTPAVVGIMGFEDHGRASIAEEHGYISAFIRIIQAVGLDLRGAEKNFFECSGPDVLVGYGQGIDETAALVADIQGANALNPEFGLDHNPDPRKIMVGGQRRGDDEIDL